MLIGHIDRVDRHFLQGWAMDTDHPNLPIEISVIVNGQEWGRVLADNLRIDMRDRGTHGDGRHGFTYLFERPMSVLASHDVRVIAHHQGNSAPVAQKSTASLRFKRKLPVLVTASGRSGTTILMQHLRSSPSIVIPDKYPYELKLLTYYSKAFDVLTSAGNPTLSMKDGEIYLDPHHIGSNPFNHFSFQDLFEDTTTVYDFFERKVPPELATTFQSIISDFYDLLAERIGRQDGAYFSEKCDILHPTRDFVRYAFEDFREIVLVRDPRDVFCSYRSFWGSRPQQAILVLKNTAEKSMKILQSQDRGRVLFVRYEDLVFNKADALRRISEFLELAEPLKPDASSDAVLFKKHGTSKDAASSVGRWKQELSAEEREGFAEPFAAFLSAFGYDSTGSHAQPRRQDPASAQPAQA